MALGKLIEFDGKIPVWALLTMGVAQVLYGYQALNDLDKRLTLREQASVQYSLIVDKLQLDQREVMAMKGDISTLKELLVRIERKLDNPPR